MSLQQACREQPGLFSRYSQSGHALTKLATACPAPASPASLSLSGFPGRRGCEGMPSGFQGRGSVPAVPSTSREHGAVRVG